jgi:hypothetical protein
MLAKDMGLRVFSTCRISEDEKYILMTNGNKEGKYVVASNLHNNVTLENFGLSKLKLVHNLDQLIESVFNEALKANEKNIDIGGSDSLFFQVSPEAKGNNVDFFLGDLDLLRQKTNFKKEDTAENMFAAKEALRLFCVTM